MARMAIQRNGEIRIDRYLILEHVKMQSTEKTFDGPNNLTLARQSNTKRSFISKEFNITISNNYIRGRSRPRSFHRFRSYTETDRLLRFAKEDRCNYFDWLGTLGNSTKVRLSRKIRYVGGE